MSEPHPLPPPGHPPSAPVPSDDPATAPPEGGLLRRVPGAQEGAVFDLVASAVPSGAISAALGRALTRLRPGDALRLGADADPWGDAQAHGRTARILLRLLLRREGLRLLLLTRSPRVLRELDLLRRVADRHAVRLAVPLPTPDRRLAALLEPGAPPPGMRLAVLRRLRAAGLDAELLLAPVIPGVTDAEADLRELARRAREAGARRAAFRLTEAAGPALLQALRASYPRVAARHEVWVRTGPRGPAAAHQAAAARVLEACRRADLEAIEGEAGPPERAAGGGQRVFAFA